MQDTRLGQPFVGQSPDPLPAEPVLLTAAPQRFQPVTDDLSAECFQRPPFSGTAW